MESTSDRDQYLQEVLAAHNKLRTDPKYFVPALEDMVACFEGKRLIRPGRITLRTNEGKKAVQEAIDFLNEAEPLGALELSKALCSASQDHANDTGSTGKTGHTGSRKFLPTSTKILKIYFIATKREPKGSDMSSRIRRYAQWDTSVGENIHYGATPEGGHEAVLALLVDGKCTFSDNTYNIDGVSTRGHRKNIFNPTFKYLGVGVATHKSYKQVTVVDYAGGITPLSDGDAIATKKGVLPKHKPLAYKKKEESKGGDDGYVKLTDCPEEIQDQIKAMKLGSGYKIKKVGGEYKVEYCTGTLPSEEMKAETSHEEPEGYK